MKPPFLSVYRRTERTDYVTRRTWCFHHRWAEVLKITLTTRAYPKEFR